MPCSIVLRLSEMFEAMTGREAAMASSKTFGKLSHSDGSTITFESRINCGHIVLPTGKNEVVSERALPDFRDQSVFQYQIKFVSDEQNLNFVPSRAKAFDGLDEAYVVLFCSQSARQRNDEVPFVDRELTAQALEFQAVNCAELADVHAVVDDANLI